MLPPWLGGWVPRPTFAPVALTGTPNTTFPVPITARKPLRMGGRGVDITPRPYDMISKESEVVMYDFKIPGGKMMIEYPNGIRLSIVNHPGSYTENHTSEERYNKSFTYETNTVEVGIFKDYDFSHFFRNDQVQGWVTKEELRILADFLFNRSLDSDNKLTLAKLGEEFAKEHSFFLAFRG
jgi:hypothetical protein